MHFKRLFLTALSLFLFIRSISAQQFSMAAIKSRAIESKDILKKKLGQKGSISDVRSVLVLEYSKLVLDSEDFGTGLDKISKTIKLEASQDSKGPYFYLFGKYYLKQGNRTKSYQSYNQALYHFRNLKDTTGIVLTLEGLADLHLNQSNNFVRNPERAKPYADEAVLLAEKYTDKDLLINAMNVQVVCYNYLDRFRDKVQEITSRQFKIIDENSNLAKYRVFVISNLGQYYAQDGEYQKIYNLLKDNMGAAEKTLDKFNHYGFVYNFANVCFRLDKMIEAKTYYQEIIDNTLNDNKLQILRRYAFEGLKKVNQKQGNFKEALVYSDSSFSVLTKIYKKENLENLLEAEEKYKNKEIASKNSLLVKENKLIKSRNIAILAALAFSLTFLTILVLVIRSLINSKKKIQKQKDEIINLVNIRDKYLNIIAHDLRSPISAMHNMYQSIKLLYEKKRYGELKKLSSYIDEAGIKTTNLIDNLFRWGLSQSDLKLNNIKKVNITELIDSTVAFYSPLKLLKNYTVEINVDLELSIVSDYDGLQLILRNLLDNAIKSLNQNAGKIEITVKELPSVVNIKISDNGRGIEEHVLHNINEVFEFEQSRVGVINHNNLGMGIVLVSKYVKLLGGFIRIESKKDYGTEVILELPKSI
jgi:signal transduction histidine kinase/tetratricopeptide (TPR) repeat protein